LLLLAFLFFILVFRPFILFLLFISLWDIKIFFCFFLMLFEHIFEVVVVLAGQDILILFNDVNSFDGLIGLLFLLFFEVLLDDFLLLDKLFLVFFFSLLLLLSLVLDGIYLFRSFGSQFTHTLI